MTANYLPRNVSTSCRSNSRKKDPLHVFFHAVAGPTTKGIMEANCLQFQPRVEFLHLGGFKTFLFGKHYGIFLEQ